MAFYQKYRSQKFSDLIGQDHIRDTLIESVKSGKISHAYLLTGPRGTGKTSTARLLAKAVNCLTTIEKLKKGETVSGEPCNKCSSCLEIMEGKSVDIVEIDAASHTGVDDIRDLIEKVRYAPNKAEKKVYIIDEVHMLSKSAFNALLKTLEEPPKHLVFILATTEAYKLPSTILSRVQRYDFKRVSKDDIVKNLRKIADAEKIKIGDDALEIIALSAQGGHRDAIVLLEKISSLGREINMADILNILGIADKKQVTEFLGAIFNADTEEGLKIAHRLYEEGTDMTQLNKDVLEVLRKVLLLKESGAVLFEDTAENIKIIKDLSEKTDTSNLLKIIEAFIKSGNLLKDISYPVLPIEMAIVEAQASTQNTEYPATSLRADRIQNTVQEKEQTHTDPSALPQDDKREGGDDKKNNSHPEPTKSSIQDPITSEGMLKQVQHDDKESSTETVSVYQMTDDIWNRLIVAVKKENNSLAALLRDTKPLEYSDKKLVLGVKFKFHKDKISLPNHLQIIEKVFCDISGNECIVACKLMESKAKSGEITSGEDLQKAAEEIFS